MERQVCRDAYMAAEQFAVLAAYISYEVFRKPSQMQEKDCMCTAVYCGHASGEKCLLPAGVLIRIAVGTIKSGLGPHRIIRMCKSCWVNLQQNLPGFSYSVLPESKAG